MAQDDLQQSPLEKALKKEKELQDAIKAATETIKAALQEIEKIKQFRQMYRSFSPEAEGEKEVPEPPPPAFHKSLKGSAYGNVQTVFQTLAVAILREVGRPMVSNEFIEEFRKRGHPLGGNEVRTAWNRLWLARKAGLLTYHPKLGYWIAGEPLSKDAEERARAAVEQMRRRKKDGLSIVTLNKGKPKGPPRAMTPEQVATAERMLLAGRTLKEVADLFGIAIGTLTNYTGDLNEVIARHPDVVVPKRPYRVRPGFKPKGRPRVLTPEQDREIAKLRAQGKSIEELCEIMGLKRTSIYAALKRAGATTEDEDVDLSAEFDGEGTK